MKTKTDHTTLSYLLAMSVIVNIMELMIPRFPLFPWIKLGLANTFLIAVIVLFSPAEGVRFAFLRTIIAGILSGMPATSFFFSGFGGISAALVMGGAWVLLGKRNWIGLCGIGILGAVTHNSAQLIVAYMLFVRNTAFLWQIPPLLVFSVFAGSAVGFLSLSVIRSFTGINPPVPKPDTNAGTYNLIDKAGIPVFLLLIVWIFAVKEPSVIGISFLLMIAVSLFQGNRLSHLFGVLIRFWGLYLWIILSFLLFSSGHYWFSAVTVEGAEKAAVLVLRILFCVTASFTFIKPAALNYILSMAQKIGIGADSVKIISNALVLIPAITAKTRMMKLKTFSQFSCFVDEVLNERTDT